MQGFQLLFQKVAQPNRWNFLKKKAEYYNMVGNPEYILSKKCFQCELTTRENTIKIIDALEPFTKASKLYITLRQQSRTESNNIQKLSKQENANNALNNLKMAIPIITKDNLLV